MTDSSSIVPHRKLVQRWMTEFHGATMAPGEETMDLAARAARWGSDQELEACCEWLVNKLTFREDGIRFADELRKERRPKPPSLKERALNALSHLINGAAYTMDTTESAEYIRQALEQLPND